MNLTWTIKEAGIEFPEDRDLHFFAVLCPQRTWNLRPFRMWGTVLSVERFGNSANVYTTDDAGTLHRVGLFTWGMDKREAQHYAS